MPPPGLEQGDVSSAWQATKIISAYTRPARRSVSVAGLPFSLLQVKESYKLFWNYHFKVKQLFLLIQIESLLLIQTQRFDLSFPFQILFKFRHVFWFRLHLSEAV